MAESPNGKNMKAVFFGELLARLSTKRHERIVQAHDFEIAYTGAEANAAVCAANFGLETFLVSAVPDNEIGQASVNFVRQFGVDTRHVVRKGSRLGIFYLESGASQRPSKVVYDRAGSAFTELAPGEIDWDAIFAGKQWFHWSGTVPALGKNAEAVMREACQSAKKHGLTVSCDLNYRSKLWSIDQASQVMTGLMPFVDVLIGGREDASSLLLEGEEPPASENQTALDMAKWTATRLHQKYGFRYVASTLRSGFSADENSLGGLLSDGKTFYTSESYQMRIVDRVGGGDAYSGALIFALLADMPPQHAVSFAAAASCLKHSIHGDFNHASLQEVEALVQGSSGGRIQR